MANHWHMVVRPETDKALGRWMGWVGVTHVRRYHEHYHSRGGGHLYQGRFKSFPVQEDDYFLTLCRYGVSSITTAAAAGTCTRGGLRASPCRKTITSSPCAATWKPTHCARGWSSAPKTGNGADYGGVREARRTRTRLC